MGKRYIDADKLNAKLMDEYYGMISDESMKIYKIMQMLDNAPTADVQEVRHGKWQLQPVGIGYCWECSVCHMNPRFYSMENTKYCPNCGAKMGGDER